MTIAGSQLPVNAMKRQNEPAIDGAARPGDRPARPATTIAVAHGQGCASMKRFTGTSTFRRTAVLIASNVSKKLTLSQSTSRVPVVGAVETCRAAG